MIFDRTTVILAIAAVLDYLIGDPKHWLHPVQVIGWVIRQYSQLFLGRSKQRWLMRWAGVGLAIGVIGGSGYCAWLFVRATNFFHPILGIAIETILLASCFAGRSLRMAAIDVIAAVRAGDLVAARSRLSQYVGRDTENLSEAEILRAVLETVTENATDGVMAPLFYAIVGSIFSLTLPFAIAYKAASTLDSMVGYKEMPYADLGWCSARLEDVLTWLPCRLHVLTLALLSGKPRQVWQLCQRDAPQDPSPNAGWSECAYAAILGVQLGGTNQYRGVVKQKPLLGDSVQVISIDRIEQAMRLTRISFLIWLSLALTLKNLGQTL